MFNTIKQLKQQNEVAFNFALAGLIALLLAVSALVLLWHGLIEQRQIAKQVGNLQSIESRIETIVMSKKLDFGEEKAFLEFENNIKSFNQQWTELKQQDVYSDKTVKAVDTVWQRINSNAQIILAKKKEVIALGGIFQEMKYNFKLMHKINDELVNILLPNNTDSRQVLMVKQLNVLLLHKERVMQNDYDGVERGYVTCEEGDPYFENMGDILNGFWIGDRDNYDIKKIEDKKAKGLIEQEMALYQKIYTSINTFYSLSPEFFQFREAEAAIYRDSPELKSTLAKLNNHQLNKGLIVFAVCVWLAFFVCVFGFLRALNTKHID